MFFLLIAHSVKVLIVDMISSLTINSVMIFTLGVSRLSVLDACIIVMILIKFSANIVVTIFTLRVSKFYIFTPCP